MVLKVLRFGTRKLFEKHSKTGVAGQEHPEGNQVRKAYEIDFEALEKLLDREA